MRREKSTLGLLLTVLLVICASAALAMEYRPANEEQARRQAISLFCECAFHPEYGGETQAGRLTRWEQEITIWAGGNPTKEDLGTLDRFIAELGERVEGMPQIRRVRRDTDAAVRIWFIPEYMMKYYLSDYVEENRGFFSYQVEKDRIVSARVGVATDSTEQEERNHLIQEELVGALGLPGDHMKYRDSILYDGWTTTQNLSEVDWRMLEILYSSELQPGMSEQEAKAVLTK